MKRLLIVALAVLLAAPASVRSEGPDDRYIQIYGLIQEGDQLARTNQPDAARQRYTEAIAGLKQLQASYPQWNTQLIEFRLRTLEAKVGPAAKPPPSEPGTQPPQVPQPQVQPPAQPLPQTLPSTTPSRVLPEVDDRDSQIQQLRQQVARLQNDKAVLDAKLREALAVQPAAVDPRELIRAEERIVALEKDKEVLRVSLQLAEAKVAEHGADSTAELRKTLAEARQRLAEQSDTIMALRQEKTLLQQHLQSASQASDTAKALSTENEALKKQLAQRAVAPAPAPTPSVQPANEQVQRELASTKAALQTSRDTMNSLQVRVRTLQEERDKLDATRRDLQAKLESAAKVPSPAGNAESARLAQVQRERDELQSKLAAATQELSDARAKASQAPAPPPQLSSETDSLRARLAVLEARKVPYSPEELALFKKPATPQAVAAAPEPPATPRELPASAATLLAEAHRAFSARRFDEAEKKYLEVLEADDKNTAAIQRLAAVQIEQNRPKDAEVHLKKALEVSPKDARTLLLMGIAQFDQERYEPAFDYLSRSAEADPQNPETHNYLGITLSQRGQRAAAETALRKAIQLSPNYPSAHYNLAVIYATQQPPFTELARFHYQKALAFGHAPNPELEKIMERKEPSAQQ